MRTLKKFKVTARKPSDHKFGDFIVTDVDYYNLVGKATFGKGAETQVDLRPIIKDIRAYTNRKKFYVRVA